MDLPGPEESREGLSRLDSGEVQYGSIGVLAT